MNFQHVSYSFDPKGRAGLYDINLEIPTQKIVAIMGPNGAGKSTLLKILHKEIIPQQGTILSAFARPLFFPPKIENQNLTVKELLIQAIWEKMEEEKKLNLARDWALEFEFTSHLHKPFHQLSLGTQTKVLLAICLINYPDCLLLDEPLVHLDPSISESFMKDLKRITQDKKISVMIATHDKHLAFAYADLIVLMQYGQVESYGTPEELFFHPPNIFVAQQMNHENLIRIKYVNENTFDLPWGKMQLPLAPKKDFLLVSLPSYCAQWGQGMEVELIESIFQGQNYKIKVKKDDMTLSFFVSVEILKKYFKNNYAQVSFNSDYFIYLDCLS